ncbi:MAG: B12-binding domain-containing radical SAM protein [Rhodospirillaceae bacterium]
MADVSLVNFFLFRSPGPTPFAAMPMGPLYIAASLREAGHIVQFLDHQLCEAPNPYAPEVVADLLMQAEADVIGISVMSNMLPFLILGLERFKQRRPNAFIVLGGSGVSGVAPALLKRFAAIDAVIAGEGEDAMIALLRARRGEVPAAEVGGMVWRGDDEIRVNPRTPRGTGIDRFPPPAYDILAENRPHYIGQQVLTARGCPYACVFCDIAPNWSRKVTYRDLDQVLDEIAQIRETDAAMGLGATQSGVSIIDDVFALSEKRVRAFCERVLARQMTFTWSCMCRVDLLDPALMDLMHQAGCRRIFLGIESGSPRVRDIAGKGLRIENVEQMIVECAQRFDTRASFILGFPFESLDDFRETAFLMAYCLAKGATTQISILSPLPQAELTRSNTDSLVFDPDLVSAMAFGSHRDNGRDCTRAALTPDIQELIQSDRQIFSAFYHFRDGLVREKMDIAKTYGVKI